MNEIQFKESLLKSFQQNGLEDKINDDQADKLFRFANILIETNKTFNLTAITDENEVILKHFTDCATVLDLIPANSTLIDVGCGAGFPSLPIAILRNDVKITALDSTAKRINFINSTAEQLKITNIIGIAARAEDFAKKNREIFDISISRAVARLNVLSELCLPLTKIGGRFIAMKSSKGEEEYSEAKKGIEILGGSLKDKKSATLSWANIEIDREIYVIEKKAKTPIQYPRNFSQISKKPL